MDKHSQLSVTEYIWEKKNVLCIIAKYISFSILAQGLQNNLLRLQIINSVH